MSKIFWKWIKLIDHYFIRSDTTYVNLIHSALCLCSREGHVWEGIEEGKEVLREVRSHEQEEGGFPRGGGEKAKKACTGEETKHVLCRSQAHSKGGGQRQILQLQASSQCSLGKFRPSLLQGDKNIPQWHSLWLAAKDPPKLLPQVSLLQVWVTRDTRRHWCHWKSGGPR